MDITEEKEVCGPLTETIKVLDKVIAKTDEINKRLVVALIVVTITLSFVISFIVLERDWLYFKTDYMYPDITQTQTQTNDQKTEVNGGSK